MSEGKSQSSVGDQWKAVAIVGPILLFGFLWVFGAFNSNPTAEDTQAEAFRQVCENKIAGLVAAQQFVEDMLLAPSTAEFGTLGYDGVAVVIEPGCRYRVSSYVDSQNGFGTVLR